MAGESECFTGSVDSWVDDIARRKTWKSSCFVARRKAARDIIAILYVVTGELAGCGARVGRQWAWQELDPKVTVFCVQSITGLCLFSQVLPKIIFQPASLVTWNVEVSRCWSTVR